MSEDNLRLRFEIVEGGEVVDTRELDRDVVKIGKLASSHLRLDYPSVSRIHAVIERSGDGGYSVIDLGSAEGTYVNGEQVTKSEVGSGDELRFGDAVVRLQFMEAAAQQAGAAAGAGSAGYAEGAETADGAAEQQVQPQAGAQQHQQHQPQAGAQQQQPGGGGQPQQPQQPQAGAQQQPGGGHQPQQGGHGGGEPAPQQPREVEANQGAAQHQEHAQAGGSDTVVTEDGEEVEPYTLEGYYDEGGNYIPGYYDENAQYHLGYGYYDEQGQWQVAYGYYDPQGEWVSTDGPVSSVEEATGGGGDETEPAIWEQKSDREEYTDAFFNDQGGETLEIAHLWGDHVLSVTSFEEPRTVTMGPGAEDDFQVGEETAGNQTPVALFQGQWELVITPEMRGHVRRGNEEQSLRELINSGAARQSAEVPNGYVVPISADTSARMEVDGNTFLVHFTSMPASIGGAFDLDKEPIPYQAMSAAAHILFLLLAMSLPGNAGDLSLDDYSDKDRFVQMMLKPEKKKKKKPDWMKEGDEKKAAKHKGEETKAGKEDSKQKDKEMAVKGPPDNENPQLKKKRDKKIAMNAGVMKMFQQEQVSSRWGKASKSVGSDAIHALGNLKGDSPGTAQGFGGLGLKGAGRGGGGGMSERGLGIGRVGTAGRGGGGRGGNGYGEGAGDLGKKNTARPQVVPQRPAVEGSLDKEIIRKVVRQHRREIKYCYEKELQKNKSLKGRVVVQFTISPAGDVVAALITKSTLNNTAVEQCMQGKIRRWTFPEPKGGGIVKVNYPFNLSSS